MALLILVSVPLLMLVVLANLGQNLAWARWLTYLSLLALAGLVTLTGFGVLLLPPESLSAALPPGLNPDLNGFGRWLIMTGVLAGLPALAAITAALAGRSPRLGPLAWAQPVQTTALVFVVLFAGTNLSQNTLLDDPAKLAELGLSVGIGDLAVQTLLFVLMALLGVGLGIRRSGRETLARLGLRLPALADLRSVVLGTAGLLVLSLLAGSVLTLVSPESSATAEAMNSLLIGAFQSIPGALILGLLSGIGEEMLYRGALQPAFGLWATSFIFAIHHIQYLNLAIVLIFLLGLALGWIRNRYSTTTAALVHAAYNATLVILSIYAANLVGN